MSTSADVWVGVGLGSMLQKSSCKVTELVYIHSHRVGGLTGGFSLGFLLLKVELGYPTPTNPRGLP